MTDCHLHMRYGTPAKGITTITPTCTCGWTGSTARWTNDSQRTARTEWLTHPPVSVTA